MAKDEIQENIDSTRKQLSDHFTARPLDAAWIAKARGYSLAHQCALDRLRVLWGIGA